MKQTLHVSIPKYPWSIVKSPISESFYEDESQWYDEDYDFMPAESIRRYKKQRIIQVGACMAPTVSNRNQFNHYSDLENDLLGMNINFSPL